MYFLAFNDAIIVPWLCMCLCHIKHTRPHTHTHHPNIQKKGTRYTLISFHLTLIHTKISMDVLFTGYWIAREQCYYLELKFCFFCVMVFRFRLCVSVCKFHFWCVVFHSRYLIILLFFLGKFLWPYPIIICVRVFYMEKCIENIYKKVYWMLGNEFIWLWYEVWWGAYCFWWVINDFYFNLFIISNFFNRRNYW